jgi:subtilisin family serine protease
VAGAAALVWAANPGLSATQVAWILKTTASGNAWNSQLGWGRLDVGAAVELATRASPWERRALLKPRRF